VITQSTENFPLIFLASQLGAFHQSVQVVCARLGKKKHAFVFDPKFLLKSLFKSW
jgi:hypothetical protein